MKLPAGFDLNSVEIFMLTAELGGMTQTAQQLGTTQSAVSQTISKLEAALGVRLFDRAMRPLALTPTGKLMYRDGKQLLAAAKTLLRDVRDGNDHPHETLTIALAESLANELTAPLLRALRPRARRWQVRSGISLLQHHDFLARKLDMLVTGSSQLEDASDIEHHLLMEEEFVLVAPAGRPDRAQAGPIESLLDEPFIRYSLLSAMGQRIERQVARLRLSLPNVIEIDSTAQQLTSVAAGIGWSITTPLCLASHLELLPQLHVAPMERGQFWRRIQIVARAGEFGDLPRDIAREATTILQHGSIARLTEALPWIQNVVRWPSAE